MRGISGQIQLPAAGGIAAVQSTIRSFLVVKAQARDPLRRLQQVGAGGSCRPSTMLVDSAWAPASNFRRHQITAASLRWRPR